MHVKEVARSDKPTDNYYQTLQLPSALGFCFVRKIHSYVSRPTLTHQHNCQTQSAVLG